MTDQVHCELHGLQDASCIVCARLDLAGMRDFQAKYIKADQEIRALRKIKDAYYNWMNATASTDRQCWKELKAALSDYERGERGEVKE